MSNKNYFNLFFIKMSNFRKFISMSAVAVLGVTNLLTPLSYASASDVIQNYDDAPNPISTADSFKFLMPDHHVYLKASTEPNRYSVTYNGNTETSWEMPDKWFTYDQSWTLDQNAYEKTWYSFVEWKDPLNGNATYENGAEIKNLTTAESGNVPIYAQWSPNTYSIDYNLNPTNTGTTTPVHGASHPTDATYDSPFEVSNPTRTWYTFSGWDITNMDSEQHTVGWNASSATGASGVKGTGFNNLRATSGTVHFAAKWTANKVPYKVEHYIENLTGWYPDLPKDTDDLTGTADTEVKPAVKPYTWFTPRPSDTPTSGNIEPDGGKVFKYHYTRDSYNLTINAGRWVASVKWVGTVNTTGATTSSSTSISFKYDEPVTLSFVLKDWYKDGTWSGYQDEAASFNMPAFSTGKTAYATPIVYTITYNYSWADSIPSNPATYTVESGVVEINNPARQNSTFEWWIGWVVDGDQLSEATKNLSFWPNATGNRNYIAKWTCLSWYHLNDDQTKCNPDSDTEYHVQHQFQNLDWTGYDLVRTTEQTGETAQMTSGTTIAHVWFEVKSIDNKPISWDGSTIINIRYDRLAYTWTIADPDSVEAVSITATAEGDHPTGVAWTYKFEDTVTINATLKTGYIFNGWTVTRKDNGASVTVSGSDSLSGATFKMPASEVTITPTVTRYPYTITYELHSGSVATPNDNHTGYNVETPTFTLTNPTRDHSKFVWWSGWVIGEEPTTNNTVKIDKWSVWNRSYEAIWECDTGYHKNGENECVANDYTVNIDLNYADGTDTPSSTWFKYDTTWTIENPQQSWYDFAWWIVTWVSGGNATADGKPITSGSVTSGEDFKNLTTENGGTVTLTATWTERDDTKFTVYHYYENLNADTYFLSWTFEYTWVTASTVTIAQYHKAKTWFAWAGNYTTWGTVRPTDNAVLETDILKDGSRKIYIYYQRFSWDVYLSGDEHVAALYWKHNPEDELYTWARRYEYEDTVSVRAQPAAWYHFKEWKKKTNSTFTTDGNGN